MKLSIYCQQCHRDELTESFSVEVDEKFFQGQDITCPQGHDYFLYVNTPRYAFLFQQALESFRSNFYFECFHTLYSGFEFYKKEFVEVVVFEKLKKVDTVQTYCKTLNRSEQIDGAFKLAYIQQFGKEPPLLPDKMVTLRNKVTHRGTIPSEEDCILLGNAIFKIVIEINHLFHDEPNKVTKSSFTEIGFQGMLAYNFQKFVSAMQAKGIELTFENTNKYQRITFALNPLSPNVYFKDSTDGLFQRLAAQNVNLLNMVQD